MVAAVGASALATPKPRAETSTPEAQPRPSCAVPAQRALIGNTRGKGAFLRAEPSTASSKLPLPEGTAVRLTGRTRTAEETEWSEVEVPPVGRAGWVVSKYLVELR